MLLFFVGILFGVIYFCYEREIWIILLAFVCCISSIFPIEGFDPPEFVEEVKLISVANDKQHYLKETDKYYVYAYNNKQVYDIDGIEYHKLDELSYNEERVNKSLANVYCSEECIEPVVKIYKIKAKSGVLSIAFLWTKNRYDFYIPKDSVQTKNLQ